MRSLLILILCGALSLVLACEQESSPPTPASVTKPGNASTTPDTQPSSKLGTKIQGLASLAADDAIPFNTACPVTGEKVNDSGGKIAFADKVYGFCCKDCIDAFQADPAKYANAVK